MGEIGLGFQLVGAGRPRYQLALVRPDRWEFDVEGIEGGFGEQRGQPVNLAPAIERPQPLRRQRKQAIVERLRKLGERRTKRTTQRHAQPHAGDELFVDYPRYRFVDKVRRRRARR